MNILDDSATRDAVLEALSPDDRVLVEQLAAGGGVHRAAAQLEERVRATAAEPVTTAEAPATTETPARQLANAVAAHAAAKRFVPKAPPPPVTSPEIAKFTEIVERARQAVAAAEARAITLAEQGGELELEQLMGVKGSKGRAAQNLSDQVAASHVVENRRRALTAARRHLDLAVQEAEAARRDRRILELKAKWQRIETSAEAIDAALAALDRAADVYLNETRDLSSWRDLNIHMPSTDLLQSSTRISLAIANAGEGARRLLDTSRVATSKRESFADLARRGAASVRAARTRGEQ